MCKRESLGSGNEASQDRPKPSWQPVPSIFGKTGIGENERKAANHFLVCIHVNGMITWSSIELEHRSCDATIASRDISMVAHYRPATTTTTTHARII